MSWFRIVNAAERKARLDIFGDIGESTDWWTGEKTGLAARDFSSALQALGDLDEIELHINSPGGVIIDGWQIYNELRRNQAKVNVIIDGEAASMASVVAMAGDTITMPSNATLWVHNPMGRFDGYLLGYSDDMRKVARQAIKLADDLDTVGEGLINAYVMRSGGKVDRDAMKALMDEETLITAERAVELGLADRIEEPLAQVASHDMAAVAATQAANLQAAIRTAVERADQQRPRKSPLAPPAAPVAMDPKAVIAACKEAGFPALANGIIAADMAPKAVRERLALAGRVRNRIAGGDLQHMEAELIDLAMSRPVDEIMGHMIALKREQFDPDIGSHLSPGGQAPSRARVPDPRKIYAQYRNH